MKKIANPLNAIVTVLLVVFAITTASAQDKAAEGAVAVTTKMKEQLTLNDAQYTKVLAVNRAYLTYILEAKKEGVSGAQLNKKIAGYSADREKKLKSVLTSAQYKTYAARRASVQDMLREYYEDKE
ncbi:MAG: hypothetical protein IE909_14450 [Campylobacterales bacterium]|nr:hypothetical protein [Campylobacterales bacterium]